MVRGICVRGVRSVDEFEDVLRICEGKVRPYDVGEVMKHIYNGSPLYDNNEDEGFMGFWSNNNIVGTKKMSYMKFNNLYMDFYVALGDYKLSVDAYAEAVKIITEEQLRSFMYSDFHVASIRLKNDVFKFTKTDSMFYISQNDVPIIKSLVVKNSEACDVI